MNDSLSGRGLGLAVTTAVCSALGIILIKSGLQREALRIAPLIVGLMIYGTGIVLGIVLIGRYPLSLAYPVVVGLSLIMLTALSAAALGEALTSLKLGGTLLIVLGVALLVQPGATSRRP